MQKRCIIPFFIPHQGCPHTCVFCNQRYISGKASTKIKAADVSKQIEAYLATIKQGSKIEVAFYGGSFTGLSWERQSELLQPAYQALQAGQIDGIRFSTRPDLIQPEGLKRIRALGVSTIELGVQSLDAEVLKKTGRGHTPEAVEKAVSLIRAAGIKLGLQVMLGLPGDNLTRSTKTVSQIIKLKPDFVRIYPTLVIRHTVLERMYNQKVYTPLKLKEAVALGKLFYLGLNAFGIPVIRIGLQPSAELLKPGTIIAGPWHPAFGELVQAAVALEQVEMLLKKWAKEGAPRLKHLTINPPMDSLFLSINPRYYSRVVGQKQRNLQFIMKKWRVKLVLETDILHELRDLTLKDRESRQEFTLNWQEFLASKRIR